MKFTAVGDMLIQRRLQADFKGLAELGPFIRQGTGFFNHETTRNPSPSHLLGSRSSPQASAAYALMLYTKK